MSQDTLHNTQLDHLQIQQQLQIFPLCILADDIEIAGNVGSLFRIADAFGIEKLHLSGATAIPPKYKIRKASRSADQRIPYDYCESGLNKVLQLKDKGYTVISLEITSQSQNIREFSALNSAGNQQKICLIIGSEKTGIKQELLDSSDHTLHIPMFGKNSSMNVATSCAIAVYELTKQYNK